MGHITFSRLKHEKLSPNEPTQQPCSRPDCCPLVRENCSHVPTGYHSALLSEKGCSLHIQTSEQTVCVFLSVTRLQVLTAKPSPAQVMPSKYILPSPQTNSLPGSHPIPPALNSSVGSEATTPTQQPDPQLHKLSPSAPTPSPSPPPQLPGANQGPARGYTPQHLCMAPLGREIAHRSPLPASSASPL